MKIRLTKGALIGYLIIFGTAGLAAVLRAAGLNDVADFIEQHAVILKQLDYSQFAALILAVIGLNQAAPLIQKK